MWIEIQVASIEWIRISNGAYQAKILVINRTGETFLWTYADLKLGGGGCPGILTQIQGFLTMCPGIGPL